MIILIIDKGSFLKSETVTKLITKISNEKPFYDYTISKIIIILKQNWPLEGVKTVKF